MLERNWMPDSPLMRFLGSAGWPEAVQVADAELRTPEWAARLTSAAADAEGQGNDVLAASLRRHAAVLDALRDEGAEAALRLATSRIDPDEPKDSDRCTEVLVSLSVAEPAEIAELARRQPWLLSDRTDATVSRIVEGFVAQTDIGAALAAEYRRLLLRAFRRSGAELTLAAVAPPGGAEQRAARLRDAVLQASRSGDAEEALLLKIAWLSGSSGAESTAAFVEVGVSLVLRYRRTRSRADLALGIRVYQAAYAQLEPSSGARLITTTVSNLAGAMMLWEKETGELTYRDDAIMLYRLHLEGSGPQDPLWAPSAVALAGLLVAESRRPDREPGLLDEAEAAIGKALPVLAGVDEEQRIIGLIHLAHAALLRFGQTGQLAPARHAVAAATDAIKHLPPDDPDRRRLAGALAQAVLQTAGSHRDPELNDSAADLADLASDTAGHGTPGADIWLDRMQALTNRYMSAGGKDDLRGALDAAQRALAEAEPGSETELRAHCGLGSTLKLKFADSSDLADLDESVAQLRQAVEAQERTGQPPTMPAAFHNLSGALLERYQNSGQPEDLDDAIAVTTRLLEVTAPDDPLRPGRVGGLATYLRQRYSHRGDRHDLDQAITLAREALAGIPADGTDRAPIMSTLALSLRNRYLADGDPDDMHAAAGLLRSAVEETAAHAPYLEPLVSNYLLVLSTVASRDREQRGLPLTDVQQWFARTERDVLQQSRTTGDVRGALATVTGPPEQFMPGGPDDQDLLEIQEENPDSDEDDPTPRSLLVTGKSIDLPEAVKIYARRAAAAAERHHAGQDPSALREAAAQWLAIVRHPVFATMPRPNQRLVAVLAARAAYADLSSDDSIEAADRMADAFGLLLALSDGDQDRALASYDLARTLMCRFALSGDETDIDRAFDLAAAAVAALPAGSTMWRRGLRYLAGCLHLYPGGGRSVAARRGRFDLVGALLGSLGLAGDAPVWLEVRMMLAGAYMALSWDPSQRTGALASGSRVVADAIASARRMGDDKKTALFEVLGQHFRDLTAVADGETSRIEVTIGDMLAETSDPDEARARIDSVRVLYQGMDPQADYQTWKYVAMAFIVLLGRGDSATTAERNDEALEVAAAEEQTAVGHADTEMQSLALRLQIEIYLDRVNGIRADNLDRAVACAQRDLDCQLAGSGGWAVSKAKLGFALSRRVTSGRPERDDADRAVRECRAAVAALDGTTDATARAAVRYMAAGVLGERTEGRLADNLEEAIATYQLALEDQPPGEVGWANTHHQLGVMYTQRLRGNREENLVTALEHFAAEVTVFTHERYPMDWAYAMVSRGNALSQARGTDPCVTAAQAAEAFEAALTVFTREAFPYHWARTRASQGLLALDADHVGGREVTAEAALVHLNAALDAYDRQHNAVEWARVHEFLSVGELMLAVEGQKDHDRLAADHAELSLSVPDLSLVTRARRLANLGSAELLRADSDPGDRTSHLTAAARALEEALAIFRDNGLLVQVRDAAVALIGVYSRLGYWPRAAAAYDTGAAAAEQLYAETLLVSTRAAELRAGRALVRTGVQALARAGRFTDALVALERGRARWLGESIGRDRADLDRLATDHRGLVMEFRQAAELVRVAETAERGSRGNSGHAALREQAAEARGALEEKVTRIRRLQGYEQFLELPGLSDVQQVVGAREGLAYLLPGDDEGLALIAHRNGEGQFSVSARRLPLLTTGAVNGLLLETGYLDAQMAGGAALITVLEPVLVRLGMMVADAAENLRELGTQAVTVVACGRLAVLPVHTAPYPTESGPRSLLEEFTVTFAPSAWVLPQSDGAAITPVLAGVGDPTCDLPFARHELVGIAEIFPEADPDRLLYGEAATRPAFLAQVPGATYVHLSCHGYYDPIRPLDSHLLLAHRERLTLRELFAGNVLQGVRLAVASACQTAVSDMVELPDEAVGLPAGFLRAGASAFIGTLWPVADLPTALLMRRFYEYHLTGDPVAVDPVPMPPAFALRAAQLWLAQASRRELEAYLAGESAAETADAASKKPFSHPYYWAPFVIAGR